MRKSTGFGCLVFGLTLLLLGGTGFSQSADRVSELFSGLKWRNVGPALMGGRTVDIEAVESKPWIIYAAVGPSGVWKSDNDGISWKPVFHRENTVSVGDIAIAPSHPEIIWVGTGEATCRNSVTIGDGVYRSLDGGKTWAHMGLEETRHISRIVINPGDPNIVYVAAMGHLWGPNEERGVFKTLDGGKTWKKILYIDENTGIADLVMDPSDTQILYAAAYEHRRLPYYFSSGGPGSGLYKTTDGGLTWKKLTKDLPEGILGRIGLAVSRSNPKVVYALIEHQDGGIWCSEDRGETWTRMCDNETYERINFRPFYYSQIRVDPNNDKVVYVFSGAT
ncbi:MAG: WD40/YVTN/BNR-like repeat-containing protein, partial [Candidatus Aminicenantales bacterium]